MSKQSFDKVRKMLYILLVVLFLVSLTAASASAWYNKKGEIVSPPEKNTTKSVPAPKETKVASVPAPVIATAPSALNWDWGCNNCDNDKTKIAVITAVRVGFAEGEGCFDCDFW